jgi:hypothetical protein
MAATPPFRDAKLKIEWANQHIQQMQKLVAAFFKSDFCKLSVQTYAETGENFLRFETTKTLPREASLVIGDIIHHLRSALDYVMWETITMGGNVPTKFISFPVRKTRRQLVDAVNGGDIKLAGADIIDMIVNVIKPYADEGGDTAVWALHRLDITDKHRLLIPVVKVVAVRGVDAEDESGNVTRGNTFSISRDGWFFAIGTPTQLHITNYGQPTGDIFFGQREEVVGGQPIVPKLLQLSQLVADIVEAFETKLLART